VCVEILRDRDETLWGSGKLLTQRVSILRDRACLVKRGAASAERARGVGEHLWERDETSPVSTAGWTRRVHFVRGGGGGEMGKSTRRSKGENAPRPAARHSCAAPPAARGQAPPHRETHRAMMRDARCEMCVQTPPPLSRAPPTPPPAPPVGGDAPGGRRTRSRRGRRAAHTPSPRARAGRRRRRHRRRTSARRAPRRPAQIDGRKGRDASS